MSPEDALRRAESLCVRPYGTCTSGEMRAVLGGLLEIIEKMALANVALLSHVESRDIDAQMRDILQGRG